MKKILIIFYLVFLSGTGFCQILKDSVFYYDIKMNPTSRKIAFVEKINFISDSSYLCTLFDKKTNIVRRKLYYNKEVPSSDWEYFDEKGNLTIKKNYSPDNYKSSIKCDSLKMANKAATFNNFVLRNLRYPELAAENGIQGKVIYQIRLNENGTMTKLSILKSDNRFLSEEVIRIISKEVSPSLLIELSQKGCEAIYTMPIVFKLQR